MCCIGANKVVHAISVEIVIIFDFFLLIHDEGSEVKFYFENLCESFGIKHKPTSVKNPQANAILEHVHQVITTMLCTTELDMVNTVVTSDIRYSVLFSENC